MLTEDRDYRKQDKVCSSWIVSSVFPPHPVVPVDARAPPVHHSSCALPSMFNDLGQRAENEMFHLHHPATCTRFRGPQCCRKSTSLTPVRGFGLRGMAGIIFGTSTLPSASFIRTNVIQYLRSTEQVEVGVEARFEAEQVVNVLMSLRAGLHREIEKLGGNHFQPSKF
ncbi:hypothetical protein B0H14DRAFT_3169017 [Mycena olivaceomarginata]|nr:hypothetical protein B0H14DRAFT_3169017 [Mycena olivaceomarginata]